MNFSIDLFMSHCFRKASNINIFLSLRMFSGERKEIQANFWPATALSSSKTSTYFGFSAPEMVLRVSTPAGGFPDMTIDKLHILFLSA